MSSLKIIVNIAVRNFNHKHIFMSRWEKLIAKILSLDKDMRFDELCRVLESYGYTMTMPKGGSSHCIFRKPNCNPITIPKHEPIKVVYVKMVKNIVESENK